MGIYIGTQKIDHIYKGTTEVSTIRIGEEMTSLIEGDDFVKAKWLVGDGSAYIDTNIALKDIADFELRFYSDTLPSNEGVFGARVSATDDVNLSVILSISYQISIDFGNYEQNRITKTFEDIPFTIQWTNGGSVYINSVSYASEITYTTTSELTATLFALKGFSPNRIYSGKIAKLVISNQISLIPVRLLHAIPSTFDANGIARNADECGMYDSISGKFYGNVGSGSFSVTNE